MNTKEQPLYTCLYAASVALLVLLQCCQLEWSGFVFFADRMNTSLIFGRPFLYYVLSAGAVALPTLLLKIAGGDRVAGSITCVLYTALSIANYYVIDLHGSPLYPDEFLNTKTAFQVLSGYELTLPKKMLTLLLFAVVELVLLWVVMPRLQKWTWQNTKRRARLSAAVASLVALAAVGLSYGQVRTEVENYIGFQTWQTTMESCGYPLAFVTRISALLHHTTKPEGYTTEKASEIAAENTGVSAATTEYPDIVLILNETFYDLAASTSIETDRGYLDAFYATENAAHGMAVVSAIGKTNLTEYELLTSNTSAVLGDYSAPFSCLDMQGANTIVSYLQSLGYETWGMHANDGINYGRDKAYPAMGFDHVIFQQDFEPLESYGNRANTDASVYNTLLREYEQPADGPRFFYLLTYQNHGGWAQNDASLDTVHTLTDCGEVTDQVDEYLTSIAMSDAALQDLLQTLSESERPTIVCMMGDHGPSFLTQLPAKQGLDEQALELAYHETPLILWANYKDVSSALGNINITDVVPQLLRAADMPLSGYYEQILKLDEEMPVRGKFGVCQQAGGQLLDYSTAWALSTPMQAYNYMAYTNVADKEIDNETFYQPAA